MKRIAIDMDDVLAKTTHVIIDKINKREIDIVIFFRDVDVIDHHDDLNDLMIACIGNNIPYAVNPASAELVILGLLRKETSEKYIKKKQQESL